MVRLNTAFRVASLSLSLSLFPNSKKKCLGIKQFRDALLKRVITPRHLWHERDMLEDSRFRELLVLLRRDTQGGIALPLFQRGASLCGILQTALEGSMNCNARQIPPALRNRRMAVFVGLCVPCGMVDDKFNRQQLATMPTFDEDERGQVDVMIAEGEWSEGSGLAAKHLLVGCSGHVGWSGVVECDKGEAESDSEAVQRFLQATRKATEEASVGLDLTRSEDHKVFANVVVVTSDDDLWKAVTGESTKKRAGKARGKAKNVLGVVDGNVSLELCLGMRVIVPVETPGGGMQFKQMQWQAPFGRREEEKLEKICEKWISQSMCGCLDETWRIDMQKELCDLWPAGELDRVLATGELAKPGRRAAVLEEGCEDGLAPTKRKRFGDTAFRLAKEEFVIEGAEEDVTFRSDGGVWVDCGQIATALYALVHECVCDENDGAAMTLIVDGMLFWMGGAWVEQSEASEQDWSYWLDLMVNALHLRVSAQEIGPEGILNDRNDLDLPAVTKVPRVTHKSRKRAPGGNEDRRLEVL